MQHLIYPFNSEQILQKKKSIKRQLRSCSSSRMAKKIAILGGSTTAEIKNILELFLLDNGIEPSFYESEYNQYWQDAMFGTELREFAPDIVFIHTSNRNITQSPPLRTTLKLLSPYSRLN